jgi:tetratricopeptide (TPR) repeat protein
MLKKKLLILMFLTLYAPIILAQGLQKQQPLALAQQYFTQQDYEKALDQLETELKNYKNPKAYQLAFDSYWALQDFKSAERLAKKWARNNPYKAQLYEVDLLKLYGAQEEERLKEKLISEIEERVSQNPSKAYLYGKALADNGLPRLALNLYLLAEKGNPNMNLAYQKALLYGELGDIQSMYQMYVELLERSGSYTNTIKILLTRALNNQGNDENIAYLQELLVKKIQAGAPARFNELLIHLFIEQENFGGAFTQLRALEKRGKASLSEILKLAEVTAKNEELRQAQRMYEYVLKADQNKLLAGKATLGKLNCKRLILEANVATSTKQWQGLAKEYEEQRKSFLGAEELAPLTWLLAEIYAYRLAQTDTAESLYRNLFTKGYLPGEAIAKTQIALADLLLYTGNRWDAILFYKRAEKNREQALLGQEAKFKRARAAYFVGDFEWAQSIFDVLKQSTSKTIANDAMRYALLISDNMALDSNTNALAAYARADLFNYQGQTDSALFILERMQIGFAEHPILDEALLLQGDIFFTRGEYEKAQKAWQSITKEHREDILADDALYRLAQLNLEQFNNQSQAMELYQQLFTEFVDSFYAADARKQFRKLRGDTL